MPIYELTRGGRTIKVEIPRPATDLELQQIAVKELPIDESKEEGMQDPSLGIGAVARGVGKFVGSQAKILSLMPKLDPMTGLVVPDDKPVEERAGWKIGEKIEGAVESAFPRPKDAGFLDDVLEGVGQVFPSLVTAGSILAAGGRALAGKAATKAITPVIAGEAFAAETIDAYEREIQRQKDAGEPADPGLAYIKATSYGAVSGAIEAGAGTGRIVRKLITAFDGTPKLSSVGKFVLNRIKDTGAGFTEEALQRAAQDLIVEGKLSPEEIAREGGVGAVVQGLFGLPADLVRLNAEQSKGRIHPEVRNQAEALKDTGLPATANAVVASDETLIQSSRVDDDLITPSLSAEEAGIVPGGAPDAIQEQGPDELGVRDEATVGEGVGGQNQVAQEVAEPETAEVGTLEKPPIPDSPAAILEQIRLAQDENSTRKAVLLTPGTDMVEVPEGLVGVRTRHGIVFYNPDKTSLKEVRNASSGQVFDATLLGFSGNMGPGERSDMLVIVDTPAAQGVHMEVVPSGDEAAIERAVAAAQLAVPGGTVRVVTPGEAVSSRTQTKPSEEIAQEEEGLQVGPPPLEQGVPPQAPLAPDAALAYQNTDEAASDIASGLGIKEIPESISFIHDPSLPWAAKIQGGRIAVNSAQIRKGNALKVVMEEGLHGVWNDPDLQDAWMEWIGAVEEQDVAAERAQREQLDTREEVLKEEAAIRRLLENRPKDRAGIAKLLDALIAALGRLVGFDIPNTKASRDALLAAAKDYLVRRKDAGVGTRFAAVSLGDLGGAEGEYNPVRDTVTIDRKTVSGMTREQRASLVRHELAHKIETNQELWKESDTFLWDLWERDKRHPIWDFMGETTGRSKFDNNVSPEIIANLYADHYQKGTFTVNSRPVPYESEGENLSLPKEYPIPPKLMKVLDKIENKLGIWKKIRSRRSQEARFAAPSTKESQGIFSGQYQTRPVSVLNEESDRWLAANPDRNEAIRKLRSATERGIAPDAARVATGKLVAETSRLLIDTEDPSKIPLYQRRLAELADIGRPRGTETAQTLSASKQMIDAMGPYIALLSMLDLINKQHARVIDPAIQPENAATAVNEGIKKAEKKAAKNLNPLGINRIQGILRKLAKQEEIDWSDLFQLSSDTQKAKQKELFAKIQADPRFKNLSEKERLELTNALFEAWERERLRIFRNEFSTLVDLPTVDPKEKIKLSAALPKLIRYVNLGLLDAQAIRNAVAEHYGLASMDDAWVKKLQELVDKASKLKPGRAQNKVHQEIRNLIEDSAKVSWQDFTSSWWYANVLFRTGTWINVLSGNIGSGAWFAMNAALTTAFVKADPINAVRILRAFFGSMYYASRVAYEFIKTGDATLLPEFNSEFQKALSLDSKELNNPNVFERYVRSFERSRKISDWILGRWAKSGRILMGLDYIGGLAVRESAMLFNALLNKDQASIDAMTKKFNRRETKMARQQAVAELGPGARKFDVDNRAREILDEGISAEVKEAGERIALFAAARRNPTGIVGWFYRAIAPMGFWSKLAVGLPFLRAMGNMINWVEYGLPVWGAVRAGIGHSLEKRGVKENLWSMPEDERKVVMMGQMTGLLMTAALAQKFLSKGIEGDDEWEIFGSWYGITPQQASELRGLGYSPFTIRNRKTGATFFYKNLGPWAVPFAMVGFARDKQRFRSEKWNDDTWATNAIQAWLWGGFGLIKDLSTVTSVTQLLGMQAGRVEDLTGANDWLGKNMGRTVAGFLPLSSLLREVDEMLDKNRYRPEKGDYIGAWIRNVPFARRTVGQGPDINMFGEEIKTITPTFRNLAYEKDPHPLDRVLAKMMNNGVWLPTMGGTAMIVDPEDGEKRKMTEAEKYAYVKASGAYWKEQIAASQEELMQMDKKQMKKWKDSRQDNAIRFGKEAARNVAEKKQK